MQSRSPSSIRLRDDRHAGGEPPFERVVLPVPGVAAPADVGPLTPWEDVVVPRADRRSAGAEPDRPRLHPLHVGLDRHARRASCSRTRTPPASSTGARRSSRRPRTDRFSSHAPFHFDLSVLDLYVCLKHGGTLFLIGEELGKSPKELAAVHRRQAADHLVLDAVDPEPAGAVRRPRVARLLGSLRLVLFAGEVFPVKHLRAIKRLWPQPRLLQPLRTDRDQRLHVRPHSGRRARGSRPRRTRSARPAPHCEPLVLDEARPGSARAARKVCSG